MRFIRQIGIFVSVLLFTAFFWEAASPGLLFAQAQAASAHASSLLEGGAPGVLRLHVVANSDSEEDQRVKLLVRDALLRAFAPAGSLSEAEEVLLHSGGGVLETVEEVLREEGCAYGAQLRFGVMQFPDKTYGEATYPAGAYEALRVELGEAQGQNWWCVLFPPLCLVDIGVTDIPDSDELVFESDILKLIEEWKENKK